VKISVQKTYPQRECPSCAGEVPSNNNRCPICGYLFPQPTLVQKSFRIGGALIMLGLLLLLLAMSLL